MSVTRPLAGIAAGSALLLSGLLSGCGVAGTDWHPGVAAQVGDEKISTSHVNDVTTNYCAAIEDQLTKAGNVLPLSYLREGVTGQLVLVAAARQLGQEYDVAAGDQYTRQVTQLEQAVSQLPEAAQAAVIEIESSQTYVDDILQGVGKALAQGQTTPTDTQAAAAGQQALTKWIDDNDVQIDPEFGVEIVDGKATPIDTDISYAVGDTAKLGSAKTPDPTYSSSLPDALRCG
ncbi:hypothetical protein [Nocardioides sp.]|uniref:hypothetical protein n=1 Tax=Nocardioides sp. TaxID=35761 RepID=UPI0031FF1A8B|nr:hypothetical protein [Nocardioides sp.]